MQSRKVKIEVHLFTRHILYTRVEPKLHELQSCGYLVSKLVEKGFIQLKVHGENNTVPEILAQIEDKASLPNI